MKWERRNQSEPNEKKALKTISCGLGNLQKSQRCCSCFSLSCSLHFLSMWRHIHLIFLTLVFPNLSCFCLCSIAPSLTLCFSHDCWVSNLAVDWVRGRRLVLSTSFGLWRLMPPDTLSSISPARIILVMQKSSGPGIAWGLSSGNPNNLNLIEFLLKNAKINEWIKLLLCLIGLNHIVCDLCVFGEISLKCFHNSDLGLKKR